MQATARSLDRFSAALSAVALWGAVLAVLAMTFAAGYQVVARYIFDAPPIWTEELARRAMVWAGMLGASVAFRERSDPNLFPQMMELRGTAGSVTAVLRAFGVGVFALPVLYYSIFGPDWDFARGFIGRSLAREAEMMGISMAWFTAAIPIGFGLILLHTLAGLAMQLSGAARTRQEHQEPVAA